MTWTVTQRGRREETIEEGEKRVCDVCARLVYIVFCNAEGDGASVKGYGKARHLPDLV